jgi:leader peptidase (prepilin peptidase)/N-methyltransferase
MDSTQVVLGAVLGLAAGAALNACADRFSTSRGRAAAGSGRGLRWPLGMAVSASLYAYIAAQWGWSDVFWILAAYCSLLLLIAIIDLEHSLVPNILVSIGAVLVLGLGVLGRTQSLAAVFLGGIVGGLIFLALAALQRGALGMGDVKLAALIGLMTGFPWVLQALILGIMLGGVAAALAMATRRRTGKQYMPYAPYLVAGSVLTLLSGSGITGWHAALTRLGG